MVTWTTTSGFPPARQRVPEEFFFTDAGFVAK
jgi:hypothetical protein